MNGCMIFDDQWFEVWFSVGKDIAPHYILIVATSVSKPIRYLVYDPQLNYSLVYDGADYQSVTDWLSADEFELVEGRTFPDDGFPLGIMKK
jgi:hypothetical protein